MGVADAGPITVRRALFSVSDSQGLSDLARVLAAHGASLVATEGTRRGLSEQGVFSTPAEELTGIGSWFGGRIKTLHPGILGGILAPRTPEGEKELDERGLVRIDLVAVNFYPFTRRVAEHPSEDPTEFIDVGGVTLARAAAKNGASVVVLSDPADYPSVIRELGETSGRVSWETRRRLAAETFRRCFEYDREIAAGFLGPETVGGFPSTLEFQRAGMELRYGENPHQPASVYEARNSQSGRFRPISLEPLKGERLSYTNLLDLDTAVRIVGEFPTPTAAVVKHATPIGAASGTSVQEAVERAVATDPVARYGCTIAVNRAFPDGASSALHGIFVDLLAAPEFDAGSFEALARRKKLKVVRTDPPTPDETRWEAHMAMGRLLVQESDRRELAPTDFRLVTAQKASPTEACSLDFAWRVVRHAKSNAVVLADGSRTVGIGSGQPTRVEAVKLALQVAGPRSRGSVLASDAFFPFPDGVEEAGKAGVAAIIQPGGSMRDPEVIEAAERYRMAMYFTGWRVFRH